MENGRLVLSRRDLLLSDAESDLIIPAPKEHHGRVSFGGGGHLPPLEAGRPPPTLRVATNHIHVDVKI